MQTSRRIGATLLVLVALVPLGGVVALAASSRGLTGEISHIWSTLTNPKANVGDNAGRLVQFGNSRGEYWSEGLKVGGQSPLDGVGALAFGTARTRYAPSFKVAQNAHSYVIETYADLGLIGVGISLALLIAWGIATRRAVGSRRRWSDLPASEAAERAGLLTLLAVVIAYGVQSSIDWTWFIPGVTVPALLAAGWLAGRGALERPIGLARDRRRLTERPAPQRWPPDSSRSRSSAGGWSGSRCAPPTRTRRRSRRSSAATRRGHSPTRGPRSPATRSRPTRCSSSRRCTRRPVSRAPRAPSFTGDRPAAPELQHLAPARPVRDSAETAARLAALNRVSVLNPPLVATQSAIAQAQAELKSG